MISQPTSSPSSSPTKAPSTSPTNTPTGAPSLSPNDAGGVCDIIDETNDIGIPVDCTGDGASKPYCCKRDSGAGNELLGKCTPSGSVSSCKEGPASPNTCEQLPSEEGGSVTPFPCTNSTTVYEAETYLPGFEVSFSTTHTGYTGSGYVDYGDAGSYLEFTGVSGVVGEGTPAEDGGRCSFKVRFANGSGAARQATVLVNGDEPKLDGNPVSDVLQFADTGAWTSYTESNTIGPFNCNMDKTNIIRITAGPGTPGPNLDNMEVTISSPSGEGDDDIVCCVIGKGTSSKYGTCTFLSACDEGNFPDAPTSSPTFDECEEPSSKSGKSGAPSNGKSGKSDSKRRLGNEGIVPYGM